MRSEPAKCITRPGKSEWHEGPCPRDQWSLSDRRGSGYCLFHVPNEGPDWSDPSNVMHQQLSSGRSYGLEAPTEMLV
jgi:hypothetical protein